ncbi:MAG TPA: hypothetical protein VF053_10080 [Streptosporangiales bacterium]
MSTSVGVGWQCFVPGFQKSCLEGSKNATQDSAVEQALGTQYGFVWGLYQLVVNLAAWFTTWGISFQPLAKISGLAQDLQNAWDSQVIAKSGLGGLTGFVLLLAILWACLLMLFRRFRRGFAELMVSIVIACIAAGFLLHPGQTITKSVDTARYLGLTVAVISLDPQHAGAVPTNPAAADRVANQQIGRAVADKFVANVMVKPHMIANTGHEQQGRCGREYWEMLDAQDTSKAEASYTQFTEKSGCVSAAALRPSVERILTASLLLIMAIVVGLFCMLAVALLLLSQLAAAVYVAVAGVVGTVAPLPGWGRSLLVRWLTGLLVCVAGVVAGIVVVVVYLDMLGVVFGAGGNPLVNFAIAVLLAIVGLKMRKRITASLRNGARQIGARLEGTLQRPGGETLVETAQRKRVGLAPLPVAAGVAVAEGTAGGGRAGQLAGARIAGEQPPTLEELNHAGEAHGTAAGQSVGFGSRVRNAISQSKAGQLALNTAGAGGRPRISPDTPVLGGRGGSGRMQLVTASGTTGGTRPATRTGTSMVTGSSTSIPATSGQRATQTAARVSTGGLFARNGSGSARTQALFAEIRRRQREREAEIARRGMT